MNTIQYFLNFEEGQNITITSDFINKVENLQEFIYKLNREISTKEEEKEILMNTLKLLIKEMN